MNPDPETQRESLLRKAVLAGDETAWRRGAWNISMRWIGSCLRCGCRRDEADDVVQETWLVAVRQMRRFNPQQGHFLAWLRGIAVNIRRNHLRRRWRQAKTSQNGRAEPMVAIESLADRGDTVHEQQQRAEQIAEVLDAMPERQEAALRAKYLDGLSVSEIAARWNETPKAVESLLSRAHEAFRERFERMEKT